jgi:hypothetical protein
MYATRSILCCVAISTFPCPSYATSLYWTQAGNPNNGLYRVVALDTPGAQAELVTEDITPIPDYASLAIDGGRVYYKQASGQTIYSANLDGSGLKADDAAPAHVVQNVNGNALDITNTYGYFPDPGPGLIRRGDAVGGNQTDLLNLGHQFAPNLAIALDETHGKIYWAGSCSGCDLEIGSADLGGTGIEVIHDGSYDDSPADITVDSVAGKVYWKGAGSTIRRANLDFTQVETVLENVNPLGIALDIAPVPEPSTFALATLGLLALAASQSRRFARPAARRIARAVHGNV